VKKIFESTAAEVEVECSSCLEQEQQELPCCLTSLNLRARSLLHEAIASSAIQIDFNVVSLLPSMAENWDRF
jgi:hypothetical protein